MSNNALDRLAYLEYLAHLAHLTYLEYLAAPNIRQPGGVGVPTRVSRKAQLTMLCQLDTTSRLTRVGSSEPFDPLMI